MRILFEMHPYPEGMSEAEPITFYAPSRDAAVRRAGRKAKRIEGPVDLAYADCGTWPRNWSDRYITTASPSEFHSTGYRCERLES